MSYKESYEILEGDSRLSTTEYWTVEISGLRKKVCEKAVAERKLRKELNCGIECAGQDL